MSNLNKVLLMGRLTRDPELRYTPQGTAVTDIGLAINRTWTDNGERREEVTFVDVTVWGKQAEILQQYKRKGDPLFVEGRLRLDSWESQDGQKRSKLKVVCDNFQFIGNRGGGDTGGGGAPQGSYSAGGARPAVSEPAPPPAGYQQQYEYQAGSQGSGGESPVDDAEIPF